jgi:hypothetical protein
LDDRPSESRAKESTTAQAVELRANAVEDEEYAGNLDHAILMRTLRQMDEAAEETYRLLVLALPSWQSEPLDFSRARSRTPSTTLLTPPPSIYPRPEMSNRPRQSSPLKESFNATDVYGTITSTASNGYLGLIYDQPTFWSLYGSYDQYQSSPWSGQDQTDNFTGLGVAGPSTGQGTQCLDGPDLGQIGYNSDMTLDGLDLDWVWPGADAEQCRSRLM